jgi:hypothetical protein
MSPSLNVGRRRVLRGVMNGAAVTVGLPFLDCFLNPNGTAFANGAPLPVCFGSWVAGLGFNPGRWEPQAVGANYDMAPELKALSAFRDKINVYSGMSGYLDGKPNVVHQTGYQVCINGAVAVGVGENAPSIDQVIADVIGTRTRFRSLEVSPAGSRASHSRRSASAVNPAEISPAALYARIFGPEFKDPNAADFTPDPRVMARRSVLSAVADHRSQLIQNVGAADRARLDEYFTSLRGLEQQLDLELQKPAPLQACSIPDAPKEETPGTQIDVVLDSHRLFMALLAHALACGQTRVFSVEFGGMSAHKAGDSATFHTLTHEEGTDPKLGYQPTVGWFMLRVAEGYRDMVAALDGIREGDGTLLDRCLVMYATDTGNARYHSMDNIPLLTAGKAGGRIKTGIHVAAQGDPVTRVGLTVQQAMGVPVSGWGTESNRTSKPFSEVLA